MVLREPEVVKQVMTIEKGQEIVYGRGGSVPDISLHPLSDSGHLPNFL